jgi:hypothetical protein
MRIIERCRGPHGKLTERRRALIEQLLERPSQSRWERARGVVIQARPMITLEMAVNSVRRNADRRRAPDPFTLYRALRHAVVESTAVAGQHGG